MDSKDPDRGKRRFGPSLIAAVIVLAAALPRMPRGDHAYGWDESMHAALPAARMLEADGLRGALEVAVHECQLYPFVVPAVLAGAQALGVGGGEAPPGTVAPWGSFEARARGAVYFAYAVALLAVFLLARAPESARRRRAGAPAAPYVVSAIGMLALALALVSPLAYAFSTTLFLEVPFMALEALCLVAWLARGEPGRGALGETVSDLVAGVLLAACVFTKFNYGGLLLAGLGLDLALQGATAFRAGGGRRFARRAAVLLAPLALALLWWFALPWPGGADVAAQHRASLASFLSGNQGGNASWGRRVLDWFAFFVPTARIGLVVLAGALASLRFVRVPEVRALWLAFLALAVPIAAHPFHLERFLIPLGPPLWALAALGLADLARRVSRRMPQRFATVGLAIALVVACSVSPDRDARFVAKRTGLWNEERADYLTGLFASWRDLSPARSVPTGGLRREAADALLDLVHAEAGCADRVGWIGISSELSPAALHLGLLARCDAEAALERFRRDSARQMFLDFRGADPGFAPEHLARWAGQFDVVFHTRPPDLKARGARAWTAASAERLVDELGWNRKELGTVLVERPAGEPLAVTLYACRPPR